MTIPSIEYIIEPINALPKPMTSNPSKNEDAITKIKALITNKKSPKVISVTGSVKINKIGRTIIFNSPIKSEATNAD